MENDYDYEDNQSIEPDPIEEDFIEDQDDREDDGDFPESLEWEAIEGPQETMYADDLDGFDFPEFDD
jgi:hypothetical protein